MTSTTLPCWYLEEAGPLCYLLPLVLGLVARQLRAELGHPEWLVTCPTL